MWNHVTNLVIKNIFSIIPLLQCLDFSSDWISIYIGFGPFRRFFSFSTCQCSSLFWSRARYHSARDSFLIKFAVIFDWDIVNCVYWLTIDWDLCKCLTCIRAIFVFYRCDWFRALWLFCGMMWRLQWGWWTSLTFCFEFVLKSACIPLVDWALAWLTTAFPSPF